MHDLSRRDFMAAAAGAVVSGRQLAGSDQPGLPADMLRCSEAHDVGGLNPPEVVPETTAPTETEAARLARENGHAPPRNDDEAAALETLYGDGPSPAELAAFSAAMVRITAALTLSEEMLAGTVAMDQNKFKQAWLDAFPDAAEKLRTGG